LLREARLAISGLLVEKEPRPQGAGARVPQKGIRKMGRARAGEREIGCTTEAGELAGGHALPFSVKHASVPRSTASLSREADCLLIQKRAPAEADAPGLTSSGKRGIELASGSIWQKCRCDIVGRTTPPEPKLRNPTREILCEPYCTRSMFSTDSDMDDSHRGGHKDGRRREPRMV
jgi:hypothetical protein